MFYALSMILVLAPGYCQQWHEDLDAALSLANAENKKVMLFFTVPDACDSCTALEENVLESDEFKKYAANYVLARADFQHSIKHPVTAESKAKNLLIVEKYNKDGFFPLMVILDKSARIIGSRGTYNGESSSEYIASLQAID